jgi:hypothetical protein
VSMMSGNLGYSNPGAVPAYAKGGSSSSLFGLNNGQQAMAGGGIASLLSGLFGDSGAPYEAAEDQYQNYANKAVGAQNPFYNAGTAAIPQYQNWINNMQNPSDFINHLMNQYQASPYSKFLQQQSMRAGTNAASESGLTGSTPFAQQLQTNAGNIASGDMNQWLQNVLGINTNYGAGLNEMVGRGQTSANALGDIYNTTGKNMAEAEYGKEAGGQQDLFNTLGGAASIASMFL